VRLHEKTMQALSNLQAKTNHGTGINRIFHHVSDLPLMIRRTVTDSWVLTPFHVPYISYFIRQGRFSVLFFYNIAYITSKLKPYFNANLL